MTRHPGFRPDMRFPRRCGWAAAVLAGLIAALLLGASAVPPAGAATVPLDAATRQRIVEQAAALPRLHALIVAHDGEAVVERAFRGPGLDVPVNVKSAAKSVISALTGIAIDRGLLGGVDQPVAALLPQAVPRAPDPLLDELTIGNLLSMQAGLERTSGANYGRWVTSPDWVAHALSRPFVDEPGGRMLYSTGNTHLLSAILTGVAGRSTLALARDWLAEPLGFELPPWDRDPQGIYFGGNNMLLSPRALLRFGEMFRNGGVADGRRVLSADWIAASWTARTASPYSGDDYGYGWFIARMCGAPVYYARGYGGQFLYVAPSLALTVVITSEETVRTRVDGYYEGLRDLVAGTIVPAAAHSASAATADGSTLARGECPL